MLDLSTVTGTVSIPCHLETAMEAMDALEIGMEAMATEIGTGDTMENKIKRTPHCGKIISENSLEFEKNVNFVRCEIIEM